MGFLTSLFGGEGFSIWTFGLALIIVLLLIVLAVWLLKLVFGATSSIARGRAKRLSIVDTIPVDSKRNLILVRRDDVEHLLLVGGGQDAVVETGIMTTAAVVAANVKASTPPASKPPANTAARRDAAQPGKEHASAERLGLTGAMRRQSPAMVGAAVGSATPQPQPQSAPAPKAPQSQANTPPPAPPGAQTPAQPAQAAPVPTEPAPQTVAGEPGPQGMTPLDRLKALGMRKDEEPNHGLRHTGLLQPKQGGATNGGHNSDFAPASAHDSANMQPTFADDDAMSRIEQGTSRPHDDGEFGQQSGPTSKPH